MSRLALARSSLKSSWRARAEEQQQGSRPAFVCDRLVVVLSQYIGLLRAITRRLRTEHGRSVVRIHHKRTQASEAAAPRERHPKPEGGTQAGREGELPSKASPHEPSAISHHVVHRGRMAGGVREGQGGCGQTPHARAGGAPVQAAGACVYCVCT